MENYHCLEILDALKKLDEKCEERFELLFYEIRGIKKALNSNTEERIQLPYLEKPEDVAEFNEMLRNSTSYREACVSIYFETKYQNKENHKRGLIDIVCRTF